MKQTIVDKYTAIVIQYRWWFIAMIVLVAGICSSGIPKLTFDSTFNSFLMESDITLKNYNSFLDKFETDEYAVILLDAPQEWNADYFNIIRKLKTELELLPNVKRVTSIASADYIAGVDDDIVVKEFIPSDIHDAKTFADKKSYALSHKSYRTGLINRDGSKITILVDTGIERGNAEHNITLAHEIMEIGKRPELQALHFQLAGTSVIQAKMRELAIHESAIFGALVYLILIIGFYLVFRSVFGVILPVGIAILSILSVFGLMGLTGVPMGIMTSMIPSFLLSVGVASSVYLLTQIYSKIALGETVAMALASSMRSAALTCLLSGLTTAGALLAFSSSNVKAVMDVGITMGVGLLFSIFYTLILVPIAFSFVKSVKSSEKRNRIILARVGILEYIAEFVTIRYRSVLSVFLILSVFAIWGVGQLKVDFDYLGMFKPHNAFRLATETLDREFGIANTVEIVLQSEKPGDIKDPAIMNFIEQLEKAAERYKDIPVKSYSIVDIVKDVNQVLHEGDEKYYSLPDSRDAIAQTLLLFEMGGGADLKRWVTDEYSTARVTLYIPNSSLAQHRDFIKYLNVYMESQIESNENPLIRNLNVKITGVIALWETINTYLANSQITSMLLAMLIVSVVMTFLFRSMVIGLLMMLSNLFAVIVVLGFMGWMDIFLDPYTILAGAIALGILDDDTIHFVKHFQHEYRLSGCAKTAVKNTFRTSGQAIFYTSVVVTLSFLVNIFSEMKSLNQYGLICGVTIMFGMIVEFFLTPSLLLWLHKWRPNLSALPNRLNSDNGFDQQPDEVLKVFTSRENRASGE